MILLMNSKVKLSLFSVSLRELSLPWAFALFPQNRAVAAARMAVLAMIKDFMIPVCFEMVRKYSKLSGNEELQAICLTIRTKRIYLHDTMTDTDLITGLKDGNEQAYRFLYENYYAMLCHFSENLLKDRFLAESVVGEVIFNVYNKRGSLEITGKVSNYLLKSVRNRSLNYLNSRHVRKTMSIGEDFPVFDYLEESELPHAKLVRKELEEEIEKSIATLPEQTRKVFCQSRFEYKD